MRTPPRGFGRTSGSAPNVPKHAVVASSFWVFRKDSENSVPSLSRARGGFLGFGGIQLLRLRAEQREPVK